MDYMHMQTMGGQISNSMLLIIVLDVFGILAGLISLAVIYNIKKTLGGRIGTALNLLMGGIMFLLLSFTWTLITMFSVISFAPVDIHHIFMIVGMILLVLAAKSLAKLAKP